MKVLKYQLAALCLGGASILTIGAQKAEAQTATQFPTKSIAIIWPFSPGSTADTILRALALRSTVDPASLTTAVRKEVQAIEKDQPVFNVRTMSQVRSESMVPQRLSAFMFACLALVALLLTAIGIYAVIQVRNASDKVRAIRRAIRAEIDKENAR